MGKLCLAYGRMHAYHYHMEQLLETACRGFFFHVYMFQEDEEVKVLGILRIIKL